MATPPASTCLGVFLWHSGVSRLGLPTASLYLNLNPVIGILVMAMLGFLPTWGQVAGAALVVSAVGISQLRAYLAARRT